MFQNGNRPERRREDALGQVQALRVGGTAGGTRWVPVLCATMAAALGLLVASATVRGHGVTLLVHMSANEPIAQLVPPPLSVVGRGAHYDGVYYYAVARDPLARGQAHELVDSASYRYVHPGYGWLAWIASGAGVPLPCLMRYSRCPSSGSPSPQPPPASLRAIWG